MFNLTVAEARTFFVGDGAWLVHNACDFTYALSNNRYSNDMDKELIENTLSIQYFEPSNSAFSGVYDLNTGKFLARPSGVNLKVRAAIKNGGANGELLIIPDNLRVDPNGGHVRLNRQMHQEFGTALNRTVGFTAIYSAPGLFTVTWRSRGVNRPNWSNEYAPDQFRELIMNVLHQSTGFRVITP